MMETNNQLILRAQGVARTMTYNEEPEGAAKRVIHELCHRLEALQADAREKGEALGRCCYGGLRRKSDCASCAAWTATQPAQASEADKVLRKVWSILGPLPAPICNGCADELTLALEAMRDYLGSNDYRATSSQETASE